MRRKRGKEGERDRKMGRRKKGKHGRRKRREGRKKGWNGVKEMGKNKKREFQFPNMPTEPLRFHNSKYN